MNLREEIFNEINPYCTSYYKTRKIRDIVLKLIEKRIDLLISEKEKLQDDEDYDDIYFEAKISGMKEVKEMLK